MMTEATMKTTIETIEKEAENVVEQARTAARRRLDEAKAEANKIITADLPLDDIRKEHDKIIEAAREESAKELDASKRKGSQIKTRAEGRIDETVQYIVTYITQK